MALGAISVPTTKSHLRPRHAAVRMLRNIDRCEALVFTLSALCAGGGSGALRTGAERLIAEATSEGTLVVVLEPNPPYPWFDGSAYKQLEEAGAQGVRQWPLTNQLPTTAELTSLRCSLDIVPDGYGGSDGFAAGSAAITQLGREPLGGRMLEPRTSAV